MAIGNYGQLKTAVAGWLKRSDLTDNIPDLIALAESNIRRDVRCRAMEQTESGTLVATTLALPTRFLEARSVSIADYPQVYVTPQEFQKQEGSNCGNFTIKGENFHFQVSSGDYEIDYWQAFAAFADDGDTNWLLENAPDVYLWGTMVEANIFTHDDPTMFVGLYERSIKKLRISEHRARYPSPVRVRVDGMVA